MAVLFHTPVFYRESIAGPILQLLAFDENVDYWFTHDVIGGVGVKILQTKNLELSKLSFDIDTFSPDHTREVLNYFTEVEIEWSELLLDKIHLWEASLPVETVMD